MKNSTAGRSGGLPTGTVTYLSAPASEPDPRILGLRLFWGATPDHVQALLNRYSIPGRAVVALDIQHADINQYGGVTWGPYAVYETAAEYFTSMVY